MPLPQPTDKFKSDVETLPDPKLNPLLNPLLAAHMGRWAEVYFTSPPEKRGQAVAELLLELEGAAASEGSSTRVVQEKREQEVRAEIRAKDEKDEEDDDGRRLEERRAREIGERQSTQPHPAAASFAPVRACEACEHENPAGQKFCGMCGTPLDSAQSAGLAQEAEKEPVAKLRWSQQPTSSADDSYIARGNEFAASPSVAGERYDDAEPAWGLAETDVPQFAVEAESVPYRYRLYIGAVIAMLLAGLVYMAWHGTGALSGDAQSAPARAIPAAPPPAPEPSTPSPKSAENVLPTESTPAASVPAAARVPAAGPRNATPAEPAPAPAPAGTQPERKSRNDRSAEARPAARVVHVASNSSPVASEQSGAEELAMAEQYLNGSRGGSANSGEAAQWLWKAVAKGNTAATMTLSDLYLRGDGVTKSCDQARLLLDVAARKGQTAAAQRLRNLRAFGCQ
jgi:hypothetical protein